MIQFTLLQTLSCSYPDPDRKDSAGYVTYIFEAEHTPDADMVIRYWGDGSEIGIPTGAYYPKSYDRVVMKTSTGNKGYEIFPIDSIINKYSEIGRYDSPHFLLIEEGVRSLQAKPIPPRSLIIRDPVNPLMILMFVLLLIGGSLMTYTVCSALRAQYVANKVEVVTQ